MRKTFVMILFSFFMLTLTSMYATSGKSHKFQGGSFVGERAMADPTNPNLLLPIVDQYMFEPNGTVYWNQDSSLILPLTTGTFIAEIGTWKLKGDDIIEMTTIGAGAEMVPGDINLIGSTRRTQQLRIINKNTLQVLRRVLIVFGVNQDPLTSPASAGTVFSNSFAQITLKRVKVQSADLNIP